MPEFNTHVFFKTDKMKILNLGCGTKTSSHPDVVNIDWSIMLRIRNNKVLYRIIHGMLDHGRRERLDKIPGNILVHNLAKGIPFPNGSVDVVYHSHMLEHLDREVAERFLLEVRRVLKSGGIHRIVVPDFEYLCRCYLDHIDECDLDDAQTANHDGYIAEIIEQSVRRESFGTSQQMGTRRFIENLLLGDARKRGETHQWMYDRISLASNLSNAGYKETAVYKFNTSGISGWNEIGLDLDDEGAQYKPGSLYVEAVA